MNVPYCGTIYNFKKAELKYEVSLVVTETVDAGLFGECIVDTLIHAWKHLLLPPQELEGLCYQKPPEICLPITKHGVLDAIVAWFVLQLDEENSLLTGPEEETCWQQAVFLVQDLLNCAVKPGNSLILEVSCQDAYLRICMVSLVRAGDGMETELDGDPSLSLCSEAELCSALVCLQTTQGKDQQTCMLESSEIALLDNVKYHDSFKSALSKSLSSRRVGGKSESMVLDGTDCSTDCGNSQRQYCPNTASDPLYVLAVSEGFSILSLIAAKLGSVKAETNGVSKEMIEFWLNHMKDDSALLQRSTTDKMWSAVILGCVETCGLIRQELMEKAALARWYTLCSSVVPNHAFGCHLSIILSGTLPVPQVLTIYSTL